MNRHSKIPSHVAIIMDGNGRWAAAKGRERSYGHASGTDSVRACIRAARAAGVSYLTFYTFSTENWGRPRDEVDTLMELLCDSIVRETPELQKESVKVVVIGGREGLSEKVRSHIELIESRTSSGRALTVVLAVNYSSRSEIARAASRVAIKAVADGLSPELISEDTFSSELYTVGIPDPDLVLRTGGEQRLSNFLLWQAAYSELYFTPTLWPDFGEVDFNEAIADYSKRERRYGKIE